MTRHPGTGARPRLPGNPRTGSLPACRSNSSGHRPGKCGEQGGGREGSGDLDPHALVADAEEHLRGGGAIGGRRLGGAGELGGVDLQRREGVVHGHRYQVTPPHCWSPFPFLRLLADVLNTL